MVPYFQNMTDTQFANQFRAMVFKSAVWGVPFGIFWHWNELIAAPGGADDRHAEGFRGDIDANTQLVNYLLSTQPNSGTTYYADSATG